MRHPVYSQVSEMFRTKYFRKYFWEKCFRRKL